MDARRWTEIEAAFGELAELDEVERARRLAEIAERDPTLGVTLEALLNADAVADARLERIDAGLARVSSGASQAATPRSSLDPFGFSGRIVSHFRVGKPLGSGGMGVVYRGVDVRLGRTLALKFLRPDRDLDDSARQRFLREARSAASVEHPNLCTIHEVGEDEHGTPFLAMPLYAGETLARRLEREHPLGIEDAVDIVRQIAAGLACIHAAGIVHRDLKPANVMLLPDGAVKLLDFGLAKVHDETLTQTGELLGTVGYMAPEQFRGEPVDARTDLWALGVVLYEMLTDRRPFSGKHEVSIAHSITHDAPPRPSSLRADLPIALDRIVLTLLAKDPSRRPASAEHVLQELQRLRSRTPTGASARLKVAALTLILALLGAVVATYTGSVARVASAAMDLRSALSRRTPPAPLDDRLIMVPPFRVAASDASVRLLREGVVDLVAAKLTGSIRTIDARGVLNEWHRAGGGAGSDVDRPALVGIARQFGAGRLLEGSIVETSPGDFELTGSFIDVGRPDSVLTERAHGRAANIAALLDTVVAKLLVTNYEGRAETGATLGDIPLEAIDAYLSGQFAFRAGHYLEAAHAFRRALQIDSTFALAAVRLGLASMYSDVRLGVGAVAIARAHRDELGIVDRLLIDTYPDDYGLEHLAVQERAVQAAPEVPELWFNFAENLMHAGPAMGIADAEQRSLVAFGRALALDSSFTPARMHLVLPYALIGDTASARRVLAQLDPRGELIPGARWLALGDAAALAAQLRAMPTHRLPPYRATPAMVLGRFEDLEWAAHFMDSSAATRSDRDYVAGFTRWLALNRGQPARARRASLGTIRPDDPPLPMGHGLDATAFSPGAGILDVILWGADPRDAEPGLAALASALHARAPLERSAHAAWLIELFAGGEDGIRRGMPAGAREAAARLEGDGRTAGDEALRRCARTAALLLEAQLATIAGQPGASRLALAADSALLRFDPGSEYLDAAGALFIASVWERLGDLPRAIAATRRVSPIILWPFYSTYLRQRARLSALAGDREGAVEAYRAYVGLRAPAEASQVADLDAARRELDRLRRIAPGPRH